MLDKDAVAREIGVSIDFTNPKPREIVRQGLKTKPPEATGV